MKCSFIVSAYDKPDHLTLLINCLHIQTEQDFEIIVCDNNYDGINKMALQYWNKTYRYFHTGRACSDCYESANLLAPEARGDYLCFPSCDCYYVPRFLELMLKPQKDLMYCDMIYDPRKEHELYRVIDVQPNLCSIDKGGFLIRRDKFTGFPYDRDGGRQFADGYLIEDVVKAGCTHEKVPGVLWVHN